MFLSTLDHLHCPARDGRCKGPLGLDTKNKSPTHDILEGLLRCPSCQSTYPILGGVALVVPDVESYIDLHIKGIARVIRAEDVPLPFRTIFTRARKRIEKEASDWDEDLESERVNSLYYLSHYAQATELTDESSAVSQLIQDHWDHGPFAVLAREFEKLPSELKLVELGCSVGGLSTALASRLSEYLGVDSSFLAIALARHLHFKGPYPKLLLPNDLLEGPVSRPCSPTQAVHPKRADWIVGDIECSPLKPKRWDACAALGLIDMVHEPTRLITLQQTLLKSSGWVIQACPYIWHPKIAEQIRKSVPTTIRESSAAIEWLYKKSRVQIRASHSKVPWLFFKHRRQIELYLVHLMIGSYKAKGA